MRDTHLYLVAYDVTCPRRWRRIVSAMRKVCRRGQLSVFVCRATPARMRRLEAELMRIMHHRDDRLLILDLGLAGSPQVGVLRAVNPMADMSEFSSLIV